jgi:uncharacterized iron-regulated membrane protein
MGLVARKARRKVDAIMTPSLPSGTLLGNLAARRGRFTLSSAAVRKAVFAVHLWVGLVLGLYFVMLGLTGGLLVFARELDTALNPQLKRSVPPTTASVFVSTNAADAVVRQVYPKEPIRRLELPRSANGVYEFRIGQGKETEREVFVDPYRNTILGERLREGTFLRFALHLHTSLLLEKTGETVNGYGALLLLALLATGIVLWWPSNRKQFSQRMTVKRGASNKRLLYDWHNVAGMYPLPLLLLITSTGAVFVFKEPVRAVVYALTGTPLEAPPKKEKPKEYSKALPSSIVAWSPSLSVADALQRSEVLAPGTKAVHLDLPIKAGEPYRIHRELPEGNRWGRKVKVHLDSATGEPIRIEDSRRDSLGKRWMDWNGPLHEGRWGGLFSKVLYALVGVIAPLALFFTGTAKYLQTKKAQAANRAKRAAVTVK